MSDLKNKIALVTGASSGIGLAITQCLLKQQCRVIGIARDFSKSDLKNSLFEAHQLDLSKLDNTADLMKILRKQHVFDFIIHSAGSGLFGSIEQFSVSQIDKHIKTNLTSALVISHYLIPAMRLQKSGRIVFIGSESAVNAGKKGALYSSAKFGLRGLSQSLREDCSKDGICVSLINPGMVRTAFFDQQTFKPGPQPSNAIEATDIANSVLHILRSNPDLVIDEINLSPRNKSIDFS